MLCPCVSDPFYRLTQFQIVESLATFFFISSYSLHHFQTVFTRNHFEHAHRTSHTMHIVKLFGGRKKKKIFSALVVRYVFQMFGMCLRFQLSVHATFVKRRKKRFMTLRIEIRLSHKPTRCMFVTRPTDNNEMLWMEK